jgi:hypothetical protein
MLEEWRLVTRVTVVWFVRAVSRLVKSEEELFEADLLEPEDE